MRCNRVLLGVAVVLGGLSFGPVRARGDVPTTGPSGAATLPVTTAPTTTPSAATAPSASTAPAGAEVKGYLQPIDPVEVRIRPKVYGGELTINALASNGQSVKAGDVLLEIDPKPLQKQLSAALNELKVAQANFERNDAETKLAVDINALAMRQQEDNLRQAQEGAKWWETVDGPQILLSNEVQVKRVKAMVDDQQDELDQLQKMYKGSELTNATADIVVKRAVRSLELTKTELGMAVQQSDKLKTYTYPIEKQRVADAVRSATFALDQVRIAQKQAKIVSDANLVTSKTNLEDAQKKVDDLQSDLAGLTVHAAADGIVAYGAFAQGAFQGDAKALRAGEKVAAQGVLMTLYVPGKLTALLTLPEQKFVGVKAGDTVTLTSEAYPELTLHGKVLPGPRTPVGGGSGPTYQRVIEISDVDPRLVPGNMVEVHFPAASAEGAAATKP